MNKRQSILTSFIVVLVIVVHFIFLPRLMVSTTTQRSENVTLSTSAYPFKIIFTPLNFTSHFSYTDNLSVLADRFSLKRYNYSHFFNINEGLYIDVIGTDSGELWRDWNLTATYPVSTTDYAYCKGRTADQPYGFIVNQSMVWAATSQVLGYYIPHNNYNITRRQFQYYIQHTNYDYIRDGPAPVKSNYSFYNFLTHSWDQKFQINAIDPVFFTATNIYSYEIGSISLSNNYVNFIYNSGTGNWDALFRLKADSYRTQNETTSYIYVHAFTGLYYEWSEHRPANITSNQSIELGGDHMRLSSIVLNNLITDYNTYQTNYVLQYRRYFLGYWYDWTTITSGQELNLFADKVEIRIMLSSDSYYYYAPSFTAITINYVDTTIPAPPVLPPQDWTNLIVIIILSIVLIVFSILSAYTYLRRRRPRPKTLNIIIR